MGKKILLADDSITIQKVIELTFSDEDFDVITVGNGRLALEKLPEVRPDIVLCDIIMPEKDGYEVCEQIKKNPATSHIPVLLLTGAFEPFDQERAARAGFDGSLTKPFEPETLIAKVNALLTRAQVRAAAPPPPIVRPAPVAPPPPIVRPAPVAPAAAAPSFIPDEPFGSLEDSAFAEPAASAAPPAEAFASMTEEESATLLAPSAPEPSHADVVSTVRFRAGELPWNAQPVPPAPERPPIAASEPAPAVAPVRAPEPVFVPKAVEVIEEPAVFEEVLEEDLGFGAHDFEPEPQIEPVPDEAGGAILMPADVATLPPMPPEDEGAVTGAFEPAKILEPEPVVAPEPTPAFELEPTPAFELEPTPAFELEPTPVFELEPTPVFELEPTPVFGRQTMPAFEPEPTPVFEFEPTPVFGRQTMPAFEPSPVPAFEPEAQAAPPLVPVRPPVAPESFADVAADVAVPAPTTPPPSETAAFSVPVEMVEKIAQRVVAQISEKAVREIAWEVIPDLAAALIKQEIERLKAELQKLQKI
jgi:CheY-like chemotaxis protein